jgi:hypothetical protein
MKRFNTLERLLDEDLEAYYWIGFLLADGYFSKNNRLKLTLAKKDEDHIAAFTVFADCVYSRYPLSTYRQNGEYTKVEINIMDTEKVSKIKSKFGISHIKTTMPPDLKKIKGNKLFALSVGFIDGDGCIDRQTGRTDAKLRVKCHSAWKDNLEHMFGSSIINNQGYAQYVCTDNTVLRAMKEKVVKLGLPVIKRKWDNINLERVSRYQVTKSNKEKVIKMKNKGIKQIDIAKELGMSNAAVSNAINGRKK